MAATPEAKVKKKIRRALERLRQGGYEVYCHMPVQNGMGAPTLDFIGCCRGRFFGIEAKAPGKEPTPRQQQTIADMERAGALVFVYDGTNNEGFIEWLGTLVRS
jgi:hypothetical protein